MRIIGGALAGRRIDGPPGQSTRPTSDRVREAIFNRLTHGAFTPELSVDPLGGPILDLYAGSGGLGLEALSRGAPRCDFVDRASAACATLKRNIVALGLGERARVSHAPVEAFLRKAKGETYTLVFADPPYDDAAGPLDRALALLVEGSLLAPGGMLLVEHGDHASPSAVEGGQPGLHLLDQRRYGQTVVSCFAFLAPTSPGRGISTDG